MIHHIGLHAGQPATRRVLGQTKLQSYAVDPSLPCRWSRIVSPNQRPTVGHGHILTPTPSRARIGWSSPEARPWRGCSAVYSARKFSLVAYLSYLSAARARMSFVGNGPCASHLAVSLACSASCRHILGLWRHCVSQCPRRPVGTIYTKRSAQRA